jgi:hypothetical protein
MARKHGHNWIPPAANNWGATCPASHKSPPPLPLQARRGGIMLGSLPQEPRAAGYGPKSLI